jgi:hypothetical protein
MSPRMALDRWYRWHLARQRHNIVRLREHQAALRRLHHVNHWHLRGDGS